MKRQKWNLCDTYRELSCHRIKAHVHRMFEIRWIWNVWFGVIVRLFRFDFILQGFLFTIWIIRFYRNESTLKIKVLINLSLLLPLGRGFESGGPSNLSLPPRLLVSLTGGAGGLSSSLDIVLFLIYVNYYVFSTPPTRNFHRVLLLFYFNVPIYRYFSLSFLLMILLPDEYGNWYREKLLMLPCMIYFKKVFFLLS